MENSKDTTNTLIHRGSNTVEWATHYDDSSTLATVEMTVSTMRPATVLGGQEQGDHVTANAVAVEWVMKILRSYVKEGVNNRFDSGLTNLHGEIVAKIEVDEELQKRFGFNNKSISRNKLLGALPTIGGLKRATEAKIALYESIIQKMKNLEGTFNQNEFDLLTNNISDIKRTYFLDVAKILATAMVEGLNADPYVTYHKIPGHEAPASEGSSVRGALNKLRKYQRHGDSVATEKTISSVSSGEVLNTVEDDIIQTELTDNTQSSSTNTRRSNRTIKKPISLLQEINTKRAQEQELAEIVASIKALFFFPALNDQDVGIMKKKVENYDVNKEYDTIRSNNQKIFKLMILRHLLDVFRTFDKLDQHPKKEDIVNNFIGEAIKDGWSNLINEQQNKEVFIADIKQEFVRLSSGSRSATIIPAVTPFTMTRLSLASNKIANEVIQESSISSSIKVVDVISSNEKFNFSKRIKAETDRGYLETDTQQQIDSYRKSIIQTTEKVESSSTSASRSSKGANEIKTNIQQVSESYEKLKQDPNTMSSRSIVGDASSEGHSTGIASGYNTRLRTTSGKSNALSSDQNAEKSKTDKNRRKKR